MASSAAKANKFTEEKVRELARKKSNKNCFDCGKSGPQNNVNLTHHTFVCTQCAGIHRSFSHIVKTINMVNFTQSEVDALEAGGNKRAHKIWHGKLDGTSHKLDADDINAVKQFMEQVYKEKRWMAQDTDKLKIKVKKEKPTANTPTHASTSSTSSTPVVKKSVTHDKVAHQRENSESTSSQQSSSHVTATAATKLVAVPDAGIDFLSNMGSLSFESTTPTPTPAPTTSVFGVSDPFNDSQSRRSSGSTPFGSTTTISSQPQRYATPQQQIIVALQQTANDWNLTPEILQQHTAQALQSYMHQHTSQSSSTSQQSQQQPPLSNGHASTSDDIFGDIGQEDEDSGNPFADDDDSPVTSPVAASSHIQHIHQSPSPPISSYPSQPQVYPSPPASLPFGAAGNVSSSPVNYYQHSPQPIPTYTSPQAYVTSPQQGFPTYTSPQQGFPQQPSFQQGYPQQYPQGFQQSYASPFGANPAFVGLGPTVPVSATHPPPQPAAVPTKPTANANLFSNLNPLDGF